jgi:hypothetical protein
MYICLYTFNECINIYLSFIFVSETIAYFIWYYLVHQLEYTINITYMQQPCIIFIIVYLLYICLHCVVLKLIRSAAASMTSILSFECDARINLA